MNTYKNKGFTLVELIVVITILTILGTIGFISLQGYSKEARNSTRIADMKNVEKVLMLYKLNESQYPMPDGSIAATVSGSTVFYNGVFGETVRQAVKRISKIPTDPLDGTTKMDYSITQNRGAYQLNFPLEIVSKGSMDVHAAEIVPRVTGNYNGVYTLGQDNNYYALPSLFADATNLEAPATYSVGNQKVIFTARALNVSVIDLTDTPETSYATFGTALQNAYSGSILNTEGVYAVLENTTDPENFAKIIITGQSGTNNAPIVYESCTFNENTVLHEESVTVYETSTVSYGNTCSSEQRTCIDGELDGGGEESFTVVSCSVDEATGTFTLSQTTVDEGDTVTISNTCSVAPTSYTSSNTGVATISGTTITTITDGTTNITPVGGACGNVNAKTLTVIALPPLTASPGCNALDIRYGSYTIAACNAGSTIAGTTSISYGGLYQWGNNYDFRGGQTTNGQIYSTTSTTLVSSTTNNSTYSGNTFIKITGTTGDVRDWTSSQNNNLWGNTTNTDIARQGPCPTGYHVPTKGEWTGIKSAWAMTPGGTTMPTDLKLPFAGMRDGGNAKLYEQNNKGRYWTSSVPFNTNADYLFFTSSSSQLASYYRALGFSVRCFKN